jgi:hypothetical protein
VGPVLAYINAIPLETYMGGKLMAICASAALFSSLLFSFSFCSRPVGQAF